MLDGLTQDLRVALRSFARRPTFSIIAVGTLGIGIGALSTKTQRRARTLVNAASIASAARVAGRSKP